MYLRKGQEKQEVADWANFPYLAITCFYDLGPSLCRFKRLYFALINRPWLAYLRRKASIKRQGEGKMASAFDVAAYVLREQAPKDGGSLTTWKLQKLVYYAQAWSTVWDDKVLFEEPFQAWANGPVCPPLYDLHKGMFKISSLTQGNADALTKTERETVDAVLKHYGPKTAQYLSLLTHQEAPWANARKGLEPGVRGNNIITPEAMAEYYGGIQSKDVGVAAS
jgi:uncharacterized phage-associated protein